MSQQGMRTFSTEFKQAVVLRLEAGERIAAVGAELKARRKLLYEWRAAYRKLGAAGLNRKRGRKPGGARASPDAAPAPLTELARAQALIAELECKIGKQQMDLVFFAKPCGSSTRGTFRLARRHLRGHRRNERAGDARRPLDRASVPTKRRVARRLLSFWRGSRAQASGSGSARQDPDDRARKPLLRLSANLPGAVARPRPEGQSQACSAADARGQPAVSASKAVRSLHHQQPACVSHRRQSDARTRPNRARSDLGRRHYLCQAGGTVCLSGRRSRRLLP